jgi:hypothetical protein
MAVQRIFMNVPLTGIPGHIPNKTASGGEGSQEGAPVGSDHRAGPGVDTEVVQPVIDAMRRMEQEQRDHGEQQDLADPGLGEAEHAHIAQRLRADPQVHRHEDSRDEDQDRRDQRGEHAAGSEQRPEDGLVGSFHVTSIPR